MNTRSLIITAATILTLVVLTFTAIITNQPPPPQTTLATAPPPPPNLQHLNNWWQTVLTPQTRNHVTNLQWDGTTLTAHTNLPPTAQQPALTICQALTTYWHLNPPPHPVRVLDQHRNILTSNHTGTPGDCKWRR